LPDRAARAAAIAAMKVASLEVEEAISESAMAAAWGSLVHTISDAQRDQAALLHDIHGNPFRPTEVDTLWLTSNVLDLSRTIYDERAFDRLPIVADALMDAGCTDEAILSHCRSPGPHVRGCWVVDILLGK
jgi:hypothetical protein